MVDHDDAGGPGAIGGAQDGAEIAGIAALEQADPEAGMARVERVKAEGFLFDRGDDLMLRGEVLAIDGSEVWRASGRVDAGASAEALADLGRAVAAEILEAAGGMLPAFQDE